MFAAAVLSSQARIRVHSEVLDMVENKLLSIE